MGSKEIRAGNALIATNAQSLDLGGLEKRATPKLTLAVATEPLTPAQIEVLDCIPASRFIPWTFRIFGDGYWRRKG